MDENVKRIIDSIAAITPQAWQTLVEYHRYDALVGTLTAFVATVLFASWALWGKRGFSKDRNPYSDDTFYGISMMFGGALGLLSLCLMLNCALAALYPEGALIKTLVYRAVN
jgi:cell division protein FtsX